MEEKTGEFIYEIAKNSEGWYSHIKQGELIRCKDCKYHTHMWYCEAWNNSPGFPAVSDDMFCSLAERTEE